MGEQPLRPLGRLLKDFMIHALCNVQLQSFEAGCVDWFAEKSEQNHGNRSLHVHTHTHAHTHAHAHRTPITMTNIMNNHRNNDNTLHTNNNNMNNNTTTNMNTAMNDQNTTIQTTPMDQNHTNNGEGLASTSTMTSYPSALMREAVDDIFQRLLDIDSGKWKMAIVAETLKHNTHAHTRAAEAIGVNAKEKSVQRHKRRRIEMEEMPMQTREGKDNSTSAKKRMTLGSLAPYSLEEVDLDECSDKEICEIINSLADREFRTTEHKLEGGEDMAGADGHAANELEEKKSDEQTTFAFIDRSATNSMLHHPFLQASSQGASILELFGQSPLFERKLLPELFAYVSQQETISEQTLTFYFNFVSDASLAVADVIRDFGSPAYNTIDRRGFQAWYARLLFSDAGRVMRHIIACGFSTRLEKCSERYLLLDSSYRQYNETLAMRIKLEQDCLFSTLHPQFAGNAAKSVSDLALLNADAAHHHVVQHVLHYAMLTACRAAMSLCVTFCETGFAAVEPFEFVVKSKALADVLQQESSAKRRVLEALSRHGFRASIEVGTTKLSSKSWTAFRVSMPGQLAVPPINGTFGEICTCGRQRECQCSCSFSSKNEKGSNRIADILDDSRCRLARAQKLRDPPGSLLND